MAKEYLGDSVYVEGEPGGIMKLTTENGLEPTNTILLEREVFDALTRFGNRTVAPADPVFEIGEDVQLSDGTIGTVVHIFPAMEEPDLELVKKYYDADENTKYWGSFSSPCETDRLVMTRPGKPGFSVQGVKQGRSWSLKKITAKIPT